MDETAEAIARLREEARPARSSETARKAAESPKSKMSDAVAGSGNRKSSQVTPPSATRRRKTGGG